ncbi:MAG: thioredoxin family protein [Planctomycetota bacterium]
MAYRLLAFTLGLLLSVGAGSAFGQSFGTASKGGGGFGDDFAPPPVTASVSVSPQQIAPGAVGVLAVVLDHADHFHTWPRAAREGETEVLPAEIASFALRTEAAINDVDWLVNGPDQWPEPTLNPVPDLNSLDGGTVDVLSYAGRAVVYLPFRVAADTAPGERSIPVRVFFQACDDTECLMPETANLVAEIAVVAGANTTIASSGDFAGFDASALASSGTWGDPGQAASEPVTVEQAAADPSPTGDAAPTGTLFGLSLGSGLIPLAILSAVGGLILNLTPCVLPVIPIKILTLTQHAGEDRRRTLVLGLAMFAGVTAFWAALGIPAALVTSFADPSRIFGYWFVTAPMGVLMVLLAFGLMGMFSINLPQGAYAINPKADNVSGSFLFGIMTGVLGLPCFGFVAGALIPAAAVLGPAAVVTIFTSMGVGMAAPYLVLAMFPKLVERVPRTGPASELVKQVLGLMLVGFGLFFFGTGVRALVKTYPYTEEVLHVYALALLILAAGGWLAWRTLQITKSAAKRGVFGLLGLAIAAGAVMMSVDATRANRSDYLERQAAIAEAGGLGGAILSTVWNEFSPALLERAASEGKIAFVDFTADWCINCKVFEAQVLDKEPVRSLLRSDEVAMIKVDLTGSNPDGEALLDELGRVGIPTWAVIGPGLDEPEVITDFRPSRVVEAIERARGGELTASR